MSQSITDSTADNLDGSSSQTHSVVSYVYNPNGTLQSASGSADTTSDDGYGNITISLSENSYEIINNQAKIKTADNYSHTTGIDLSHGLSVSKTACLRY